MDIRVKYRLHTFLSTQVKGLDKFQSIYIYRYPSKDTIILTAKTEIIGFTSPS